MTRVLLLGGNRLSQIVNIIARGFIETGCSLSYIPTRTSGALRAPMNDALDVIGRRVKEMQPDILFWTICKGDCPDGLIAELKKIKPDMATVFHSFDDPYQIDDCGSPFALQFDHAVTCCVGSLDWYVTHGVKPICLYPPADDQLHYRIEATKDDLCDMSFVATNMYPKIKYPQVIADRANIVRAVAPLGDLRLYGPWGHKRMDWGGEYGPQELKRLWRGVCPFETLGRVYRGSRINLCSHVRPDGYQYLNERVIYVMGSGGFLLTDHVNGIEEVLSPGVNCETWRTLDELKDKVKYYLSHETERMKIANEARRFIHAHHSSKRHAEAIIEFCKAGSRD